MNITIDYKKFKNHKTAKYWMLLGIASLALAGIFSLPPVILRGPFFSSILPVELIFSTSLVLHVNLSVTIWMLCITSMIWCLSADDKYQGIYFNNLIAATIATFLITISPFTWSPNPLKNNYIPVLQNPLFFIGIALFAAAIISNAVLTLINTKKQIAKYLFFGSYSTALIALIATACFFIAGNRTIDITITGALDFYDSIFWGGGHILQFCYVSAMMIAWVYLVTAAGVKLKAFEKLIVLCFIFSFAAVSYTPIFYFYGNSINFSTALFADHMRKFPGIAPAITALILIYFTCKSFQSDKKNLDKSTLIAVAASIILFGFGGFLAFIISGSNSIIPAHYHGSIVGISLAFMALVYNLFPKFGYKEIRKKTSTTQIIIYSIGQIMHISGLAIMGGYGALRKAPGTSQNIDTVLGKMLFFTGGAIAIIGGLMFVVITISYIVKTKNR